MNADHEFALEFLRKAESDLGSARLLLTSCIHQKEVVGKNRKSTDIECFVWVNTILGNLKTSVSGTFHAFDFEKYASRYLAAVQYRFNSRFDLRALFPRFVKAAAKIGKRPEHWVRLAEDCV
jgi:hypothetical protein